MTKGIIVFNHDEHEWRLWVGHQDYWLQQGYCFDLLIKSQYFKAFLEKDFDWFVTLGEEVKLVLHIKEVYKVKVKLEHYMKIDPF